MTTYRSCKRGLWRSDYKQRYRKPHCNELPNTCESHERAAHTSSLESSRPHCLAYRRDSAAPGGATAPKGCLLTILSSSQILIIQETATAKQACRTSWRDDTGILQRQHAMSMFSSSTATDCDTRKPASRADTGIQPSRDTVAGSRNTGCCLSKHQPSDFFTSRNVQYAWG